MALNFPSTPSANATYTFNGRSWTYNGEAWALSTSTLNTGIVSEGSNLYFTNARSRASISVSGSGTYDSSNGIITISQSSNYGDSNVALLGYATNANVALKANVADLKTANVAELTNLYFTNARATAAVTNSSLSNVTISASSSSDALRITQTGAGNALVVEDSANPDSTPFVINASGQVSTGFTSNPATMFGTVPQLGVHTTGNDGIGNYRAGNDVNGAAFIFQKTRGADPGVNTVVQSGDTLGALYWTGADGTSYIRGAQISGQVDGTPGTSDMPGRLVFSTTADGASSPTERMRIDASGNVTFTGNITVSGVSRLGTVQSGTWNGAVIDGLYGGTGVANTSKTITLGGNLVTSGAFTTTLTATATTGVTLPTTGTLATLAGSETFTNKTLTSPILTTPALGLATGTSVMLSANIGAAAGNVSGNFTAGNFQTTGSINAGGGTISSGSGRVSFATDAGGSITLGNVSSQGASTPYLDFNTGATSVDYDSRIQGSGGTGVAGRGTLTFTTATATFSANVTAGNVTLSSGGALTFPDGTRQTTAATAGVTTGKSIAMAILFGG
jgi:hypothetical protein